jgi:hypothetical protein
MAPTLDVDENRSGLGAKQGGTPLPPFCVSAHSRRLTPFVLWQRVSSGFCGKGAERTRMAWPKAAFAEHWYERVRSGWSRFEIQ